jgi:uncharacterized MAPEG superfamily protein
MPIELRVLAYGALLLLVHILVAGHFKTKQYGITWNMGARDEELPPLSPVAGRMVRAQANFMETFPLAIVALAGVVIAGKTSETTAMAAWVWLGARVLYLPVYGAGIPKLRSLIWMAGTIALLVALWALLV